MHLPINLNDYAQEIHDNAMAHGFWPVGKEPEFGTVLALIHSEVSEALEAYRDHGMASYTTRTIVELQDGYDDKPDGVPAELADVIIRVLDCTAAYGIDIHGAVLGKMKYNESRPFKHGGKAV